MSKAKTPCLFDNSKECPVRTAIEGSILARAQTVALTLEKACPICPIHAEMMKRKGSFG